MYLEFTGVYIIFLSITTLVHDNTHGMEKPYIENNNVKETPIMTGLYTASAECYNVLSPCFEDFFLKKVVIYTKRLF